jgi:hypothetical protein
MTSLPEQTPPRTGTPALALAVPPVSGIWEIGTTAVRDADLAAVLALAIHRGLTPTPTRVNLPIQIST